MSSLTGIFWAEIRKDGQSWTQHQLILLALFLVAFGLMDEEA